jgi:Arc/MetJ family transcription regulator
LRARSTIDTNLEHAERGRTGTLTPMTTKIEIDERDLAAASAELGTASVEETVRAALREVAAIGARLRELERIRYAEVDDDLGAVDDLARRADAN